MARVVFWGVCWLFLGAAIIGGIHGCATGKIRASDFDLPILVIRTK